MEYKGRAQCLVIRGNKILLVKHTHTGDAWFCTPGGGIEKGETPEQAALRELREECNVSGVIVKKTSEYIDPYDENNFFYTYQIDIGSQEPSLGYDPETGKDYFISEVKWMALEEVSEKDRAFLWAAGLLSIRQFANEIDAWERVISYPSKRR